MSAQDKAALAGQLSHILGWDQLILEGVVDTIAQASSQSEVDELVQNFMENNPQAVRAVNTFLSKREQLKRPQPSVSVMQSQPQPQPPKPSPKPPQQQQPQQRALSPAEQQLLQQQYHDQLHQQQIRQQQQKYRGGGEGSSQGTSKGAKAASGSADGGEGGDGKVLGMFKQGGRIRSSGPKAAAAGGARRDDQRLSIASNLERKVANCLGCGKIFDCRTTSNDVIRFLETGGICTFCGRKVSLSYRGADEGADDSGQPGSDQQAGPNGKNEDAATAAAIAFKNRLVDYDRNSAKRTAVIDDQSDYFEVDTNNWLSDQERAQMRRQRQLEEQAEAARRLRVAVTIDLLGRRVLVADAAEGIENGGAGPSFRTGGDALAAPYDPKTQMWEAKENAQPRPAEDGQPGGVYGAQGPSTLRQHQARHLTAEEAAARAAREAEALRTLRISANPDIAGRPAPSIQSNQGEGGGKQTRRGGGQREDRGRSRFGPSRLQQDVDDVFNSFGAEILYEDVEAAITAAEEGEAFDLCPFEGGPSQGSSGSKPRSAASVLKTPSGQQSEPKAVDPSSLPPGVVLLRGWLSLEQQVQVIKVLRDLGKGPGGFYTPSYGPGQNMHLRMMCLGKHWEPRSHSYEDIRSSYDGAVPPTIPPILHDACVQVAAQSIKVAQAEQHVQMPMISPDICLVNFYDKAGRLGLHQDKDENADSLKQGIPVVSFSIGDTADFQMAGTFDEDPQTVQLRSGDAIVFGGPSRLIYHGVPKVYPGTAPPELLEATGMRSGRINLTFRQLRSL